MIRSDPRTEETNCVFYEIVGVKMFLDGDLLHATFSFRTSLPVSDRFPEEPLKAGRSLPGRLLVPTNHCHFCRIIAKVAKPVPTSHSPDNAQWVDAPGRSRFTTLSPYIVLLVVCGQSPGNGFRETKAPPERSRWCFSGAIA